MKIFRLLNVIKIFNMQDFLQTRHKPSQVKPTQMHRKFQIRIRNSNQMCTETTKLANT